MDLSPKKILIIVAVMFGIIFGTIVISNSVSTVDMGEYHVIQNAFTGNMSVKSTPGPYLQAFAKVTPYEVSDNMYFSKFDEDGGKGAESAAIKVRFNDGGTADISGSIKFRLSAKEDNELKLHEEFKGYPAVKQDLVRQIVTEALIQSATFMKAEESYSSRRAEFKELAEDQIKDGIYATFSEEVIDTNAEGDEFMVRRVGIKKNKDGIPIIKTPSTLSRYNVEVIQFVIKDIDFDPTIDALIAKKKEAEQQKVVAKANAEKAKQDAITAEEQGKARIATAKAEELEQKVREVTQAEKAFEVAALDAKKAKEYAKKVLAEGEAEAAKNRALVKAGLTPLERANIDMKTRIGVAAELAKVKFPETMILGGGGAGGKGGVNPWEAMGFNSYYDLSQKMAK